MDELKLYIFKHYDDVWVVVALCEADARVIGKPDGVDEKSYLCLEVPLAEITTPRSLF